MSASATTRAPRQGECEGESYFFHSRDRFDALVKEGGLLEWASCRNCYEPHGLLWNSGCREGRPVLLEIELEEPQQVRRSFPEAV